MDVKVRFRFNTLTGEVELFEVTDIGTRRLSEAEHNQHHDQIATELGNVIERHPRISEVFADGGETNDEIVTEESPVSSSTETDQQTQVE